MSCTKPSEFGKYFTENMNALGLPTPSGLYGTYQAAIANTVPIVAALETLGAGATIKELVIAATLREKLLVLGAFGAAGYIGASIGSIAVASGRVLGCGSRIADMFAFTSQNHIKFDGQNIFYQLNPEIFDSNSPNRKLFAARLRANPQFFDFTA